MRWAVDDAAGGELSGGGVAKQRKWYGEREAGMVVSGEANGFPQKSTSMRVDFGRWSGKQPP
jgi:hypothetical protein